MAITRVIKITMVLRPAMILPYIYKKSIEKALKCLLTPTPFFRITDVTVDSGFRPDFEREGDSPCFHENKESS